MWLTAWSKRMLYALVKSLLLPPGLIILLLLTALLVARRWRRVSLSLFCLALVVLYAVSNEYVGKQLVARLEPVSAVTTADIEAFTPQAIVVLGADRNEQAPDYSGEDTAGRNLLVRLRYAARLQRQTGLPILVSGGPGSDGRVPQARIMASILREEFQVPVRWLESDSLTTWENAVYSVPLLRRAQVERILLVTQAFHMSRAAETFGQLGMQVLPAPTGFWGQGQQALTVRRLLPSSNGMWLTSWVAHEWLGLWYYRWRYFD